MLTGQEYSYYIWIDQIARDIWDKLSECSDGEECITLIKYLNDNDIVIAKRVEFQPDSANDKILKEIQAINNKIDLIASSNHVAEALLINTEN